VHLQFNPGIGTCVKPLNAHRLQVTVDRLNRMTIRTHFVASIPQACGRMVARRTCTGAAPLHPDRLRQDAGLISRALGGCIAQPPRPGGQAIRPPSPPRVRGGSSGRASLRAASERARARHPGGRRDARAIQRTSPVWRRTTRSMRARAPSASVGRMPGDTLARGGYRC